MSWKQIAEPDFWRCDKDCCEQSCNFYSFAFVITVAVASEALQVLEMDG